MGGQKLISVIPILAKKYVGDTKSGGKISREVVKKSS